MTYTLTFEQKSAYLHAAVTGQNTRENVLAYMEAIVRECAARNCWTVLIEERLEGARLGTLDVFDIASQGGRRSVGKFEAMAYVDVHAASGLMRFAENVAVNRGLPVRVFPTVDAAAEWLLHRDREAPAPRVGGISESP